MSLVSCFENRKRKMVSFELGKEIEKDVFSLSNARDKKLAVIGSLGLSDFNHTPSLHSICYLQLAYSF